LTFFFTAADYAIIFARGQILPVCNVIANTMRSLQGVWVYMAYWYFRSQDPTMQQQNYIEEKHRSGNPSNSNSSGKLSNISTIRPDFSIFDGTNVENSDSPWSKFLVDSGEDASYEGECEYDDTDFGIHCSLPEGADLKKMKESCEETESTDEMCF